MAPQKSRYDDIIHLPHPISPRHPRMSVRSRAAQFAPFAALSGYGDAIDETGRLTDRQILPDESEVSSLERRLQLLWENLAAQPRAIFTYFRPDERKSGGAYFTVEGTVKKIDPIEKAVTLQRGTVIPMEDLLSVESELFSLLEQEE